MALSKVLGSAQGVRHASMSGTYMGSRTVPSTGKECVALLYEVASCAEYRRGVRRVTV
ncbi:MAG TPA: hypothetical protein VKP30_30060 [Polyangiaceae bacterium]|nr:hypothetical protein [Polyangiaceae bacterium]